MIPAPHRMKGAAVILGVSRPGEIGPFGPYGGETEYKIDEQDQANAAEGSAPPATALTQPG
ncbi:hypothetical protein [Streptomyces sp. NPDC014746]|uniref:hypothetical protein n=1 Tax=Streptomyces sp. NPDC014746 TaxID=3364904 RepID=UPI0036FB5FE0